MFTSVNLSGIDLNLLWVLHAVLETRSVAAAASTLHLTSPAVSNALNRLRGVVGDPLLVRQGRGLVPTPRALELQPVLQQAFATIGQSLEGAQAFDAKTCTRTLTIGLSDADQIALLPAIHRAFVKRLPRAKLQVVSLDAVIASGGLAGELVDVTIGPPTRAAELHETKLYQALGIFIARKGHPRIRGRLTPALFNSEQHVDLHLLLGKAGDGHRLVEDALAKAGLKRDVVVTVPTFFAAASLVASSDLITGMPMHTAKTLARALPIQLLKGPANAFPFDMRLQWHARTQHDPAAKVFREVIRSAIH